MVRKRKSGGGKVFEKERERGKNFKNTGIASGILPLLNNR